MSSPEWFKHPIQPLDQNIIKQAQAQQAQLTKPLGSLGSLEALAIKLAAINNNLAPTVEPVHISVFASDHGIAKQGVSAFPQAVTAEMVRNFAHGGAAICVLAKSLNAKLEIINLGTATELEPLDGVFNSRMAAGTADFSQQQAMDEHLLSRTVNVGRQTVERAYLAGAKLFIGGEMGIANTTSATALACALLGLPAKAITGRGTGLDDATLKHKVSVIDQALKQHKDAWQNAWQCLMIFGGFEIAALTGAYISCARMGMAVLVDGFIATTAVLAAEQICPGVADRMIYAHRSAEPGHQRILQALNARPLLDLGLRLGEGSGAAIAVPLLCMACQLHNEMASFADADVSTAV